MMAYVLVNKKVDILFPRTAEFWSDHGKKIHTRKYMLTYVDVAFTFSFYPWASALPFPLNRQC